MKSSGTPKNGMVNVKWRTVFGIKSSVLICFLLLISIMGGCGASLKSVEYTPKDIDLTFPDMKYQLRVQVHFTSSFIDQKSVTVADSNLGKFYTTVHVGEAAKKELIRAFKRLFCDVDYTYEPATEPNCDKYDLVFVPHMNSTSLYLAEGNLKQDTEIGLRVRSRHEIYDDMQEFSSVHHERSYPYHGPKKLTTPQLQQIAKTLVETNLENALQELIARLADSRTLNTDPEVLRKELAKKRAELALEQQKKEIELERRTAPSELVLEAQFTDKFSLIPNKSLDAGEEAGIVVTITNQGRGVAVDAKVKAETQYENVDLPEVIFIGDIEPRKSKEAKIELGGGLNLAQGTIPLIVRCTEKRGYDGYTTIEIPAVKLKKPKLSLVGYKINDSHVAPAEGNGNGIPESGEIFELILRMKNMGKGAAINVNMTASSDAPGVTIKKSQERPGMVARGETATFRWIISLAPTFAENSISIHLTSSDTRGFNIGEETLSLEARPIIPILSCSYRLLDKKGKRIDGVPNGFIENGEEGQLEVTVVNRGEAEAKSVKIAIGSSSVYFMTGEAEIGRIGPKDRSRTLVFRFQVPRTIGDDPAGVRISISQKHFSALKETIYIPHRPFTP